MKDVWELEGRYIMLQELMEDPETDPEVLRDTIEGMEGELDDVLEYFGRIRRNLEAEKAGISENVKRLQSRSKSCDNGIDWCNKQAMALLKAANKKSKKTEHFSWTTKATPASLQIIDESKIPLEFWKMAEPTVDKKAALDFLKTNGDQEWGQAVKGETVQFK